MQDLQWRVSSRSTGQGQCVEVALTDAAAYVRDTKNRGAGVFTVPAVQWAAFINTVKSGRLDLG
ncbi:MAG TPA: DUF397 domain-containing protein [Pseudonocardiaceae bacterium]